MLLLAFDIAISHRFTTCARLQFDTVALNLGSTTATVCTAAAHLTTCFFTDWQRWQLHQCSTALLLLSLAINAHKRDKCGDTILFLWQSALFFILYIQLCCLVYANTFTFNVCVDIWPLYSSICRYYGVVWPCRGVSAFVKKAKNFETKMVCPKSQISPFALPQEDLQTHVWITWRRT